MKFQRRSANHFSFMNSCTFGRAIDLNSDNDGTVTLTNIFDPAYNRGPADYDVTHTVQLELDLRAAVGGAEGVWRLAGERHPLSSARVCRSRSRSRRACCRPASPTTGRTRSAIRCCRIRPSISWFNTSCFQQVADTTGTFGNTGRNTVRGPGDWQHRHVGDQEHEVRTRRHGAAARGVQPPQPPAVRAARTVSSATRRSGRSRRCSPVRRARCAARPSGRFSWRSR